MNVLALCAGIGGLELGLGMATGGRARAVCYVERDAYAASVLMARMEDEALERAPIWDDLATFDAGRWRGAVDLVSAGFPCQPWSVAGKRKGTADERWIWPAMAGIIRDSGAPLVFLENVPGLLRHGLREVLSDLAALGFDAEWVCCDKHGREILRGIGVLDGERAALGHDADGCDEGVADGVGHALRHEPRRERCEGPAGLEPGCSCASEPQHPCANVADAIGSGHDGRACCARPGAVRGDAPEGSGAGVGHAERDGLRVSRRTSAEQLDQGRAVLGFPPGPGDAEGWRRWLAAGGPAPAEPGLRGSSNGPDSRMDRLRCLGNGVVPQQAALAFRILCARLT